MNQPGGRWRRSQHLSRGCDAIGVARGLCFARVTPRATRAPLRHQARYHSHATANTNVSRETRRIQRASYRRGVAFIMRSASDATTNEHLNRAHEPVKTYRCAYFAGGISRCLAGGVPRGFAGRQSCLARFA